VGEARKDYLSPAYAFLFSLQVSRGVSLFRNAQRDRESRRAADLSQRTSAAKADLRLPSDGLMSALAMTRSLTPGARWQRRFSFLIVDVPASYKRYLLRACHLTGTSPAFSFHLAR
jgi:hypothetical protein